MNIKLLSQNSSIFAPLTVAEAVLVKDNGEITKLSSKLNNIDNDILNQKSSYNEYTEALIIGGMSRDEKILPVYKEEFDLTNPKEYLLLLAENITFDKDSTKIKGVVYLHTKQSRFVIILFLSYPIGAEIQVEDSKYTIISQELTLTIPLKNVVKVIFSDAVNITNIKLIK